MVFIAVGIKDQYIFIFDIAEKKDFIGQEDLHLFEIVEEAGNVLPTFSLNFSTSEKILRYLNEGNDINVSFGKNDKNLITTKLYISKLRSDKEGDSKRLINLRGLYSNLKFNNKPNLLITEKKSGVEIIHDIARKNFTKIDSNIVKSSDSQNWVQYNISDKLFINDLWMHSYIPNSFLCTGITSDGVFIIRDMLKYVREFQQKQKEQDRYKYRFISNKKYANDYPYHGDYAIDVEHGFTNYWQGYQREKLLYNFEDGSNEVLSEEIKPLLALTSKLVRRNEIDNRFSDIGYQNENLHKNYWKAYLRNISSLALFSSVKLDFGFDNIFSDIKILDLIMFQEHMENEKNQSGDDVSGYYIVNKVARRLSSGGVYTTSVLASRESLNHPLGSLY